MTTGGFLVGPSTICNLDKHSVADFFSPVSKFLSDFGIKKFGNLERLKKEFRWGKLSTLAIEWLELRSRRLSYFTTFLLFF